MGGRARRSNAATVAVTTLTALATAAAAASAAAAHGVLTSPPQRGTLDGGEFAPGVQRVPGAPHDWKPHFPSGDKDDALGAGRRSQAAVIAIKGGGPWTPFTPTTPAYMWKAGVCGDPLWGDGVGDHTRGGRYYGGGMITKSYTAGGTLSMSLNIVAAHGGYTVLHVCDVAKCGGEVSPECFSAGHCTPLRRAPEAEAPACATGRRGDCTPVDPFYPDRWYMPCPATASLPAQVGGNETAVFRLPAGLVCEHCVLHWYWVSANLCNPPGVVEYFLGANAPAWTARCGKKQGGYKAEIPRCGCEVPEEYHACADIRIRGDGGGGGGRVGRPAGYARVTPRARVATA